MAHGSPRILATLDALRKVLHRRATYLEALGEPSAIAAFEPPVSAAIPSLSQLAPWTSVPPPATLSLPSTSVALPEKKRGSKASDAPSGKKQKNNSRSAKKSGGVTRSNSDAPSESTSLLVSSTEGVYDWGNSMWSSPQQIIPGATSPTANSIFGASSPFTAEAFSDISKLGKDSLLGSLHSRQSNGNNELVTFHFPDEFSMM